MSSKQIPCDHRTSLFSFYMHLFRLIRFFLLAILVIRWMIDVLISVVVAILQIAVSVGLALFSVTLSLNLLNRLTRGLDEMAELRKGNVAVGVYIAGILIAVSSVIGQGASGIARSFLGGKGAIEVLVAGLIQLFIGLSLAIFAITLA